MRKPLQAGIVAGVLILTITAFAYYLHAHSEVLHQIAQVNPLLLVGLVGLYLLFSGALIILSIASVEFCGHRLSLKENSILYAYSALVNFFGPLQSGPGMRAIYLKKKHGISLRDYTLATFFYYLFYGVLSGLMLILPDRHYRWLGMVWLLACLAGSWVIYKWLARKRPHLHTQILQHLPSIGKIALATGLQMLVTVVIYYVELRAISPGVHLSQVVAYTGAANFALFVSLTPGAIGFRESFLLFSQHIHHISSSTIVAASLLDRAAYLLLLGVLFVGVGVLHAGGRFKVLRGKSSA